MFDGSVLNALGMKLLIVIVVMIAASLLITIALGWLCNKIRGSIASLGAIGALWIMIEYTLLFR
ncbi:hypothetical protein [Paenibacillus sp. R14(2021)]|uniref:hypothetical protein n=1 Tax=Paenibacillus sp. R14(2021) TaxID=2859228 RepID=UPI001C6117D5|nr:hypothetical protein [Paenibacillus sp. R14(2021)]